MCLNMIRKLTKNIMKATTDTIRITEAQVNELNLLFFGFCYFNNKCKNYSVQKIWLHLKFCFSLISYNELPVERFDFLGQGYVFGRVARFARLASALGGTHPGTETVPRTVSMLRIALFESRII